MMNGDVAAAKRKASITIGFGDGGKRPKTESSFETKLANGLSGDSQDSSSSQSVPLSQQNSQNSQNGSNLVGPEQYETAEFWKRPDVPLDLRNGKEDLLFQLVDLDYVSEDNQTSTVRMFGVTRLGNSVCMRVRNFNPYFYVAAPDNFPMDKCDRLADVLNNQTLKSLNSKDLKKAILDISHVKGESIYGFNHKKEINFLKVECSLPKVVGFARKILETGDFYLPGIRDYNEAAVCFPPYESNIDFEIRFMVDTGVTGCCWIESRAGLYHVLHKHQQTSRCQLEVFCNFDGGFIGHAAEGEWSSIAPLRILSADIECAGRRGIFPEAEKDPVIQIANMVIRQGDQGGKPTATTRWSVRHLTGKRRLNI